MEEVLRRTSHAPLASPCVYLFEWLGNEGAFRLPGVTWDHFRCTVEPLSSHIEKFDVEYLRDVQPCSPSATELRA